MPILLLKDFSIPSGVDVYSMSNYKEVSLILPIFLRHPKPLVVLCSDFKLPQGYVAFQVNNVLVINNSDLTKGVPDIKDVGVRLDNSLNISADAHSEDGKLIFTLKTTTLTENLSQQTPMINLRDFMNNDFSSKMLFNRETVGGTTVDFFAPLEDYHFFDDERRLDENLIQFVKYKEFTQANIDNPRWDSIRDDAHLEHLIEEDDCAFALFVPIDGLDKVSSLQVLLFLLSNEFRHSNVYDNPKKLATIVHYMEQILKYGDEPINYSKNKDTAQPVAVGVSTISVNPLD